MATCRLDYVKVDEGVTNLFKLLEMHKQPQKKRLLAHPEPIFLQIDFVKIPNVKKIIARIPLQHSLLTETSEVCLIVSDLIRGRKVNHEITVNHYNKLLAKRGIADIQKIKVIPSRQIRVEYTQYEAKRKLCSMYDVFLIDEKINSYLLPKLGKEFFKTRKWPIPIKIKRKNLKDQILSKLKKTSMAVNGSGSTKTVQVGHIGMSAEEVGENILSVSQYILRHFPGGWDNIRSLHIKGLRSAAIPIYMSLIPSNDVPKPVLRNRKRKSILAIDELSTIGKKVTVYRSGRVKVHDNESDDNSEAEDLGKETVIEPIKNKKRKKNDEEKNIVEDDVENKYLFRMQMEEAEQIKEDMENKNTEKVETNQNDAIKTNVSKKKKVDKHVSFKKSRKLKPSKKM